jgi:hypothetical protein
MILAGGFWSLGVVVSTMYIISMNILSQKD